MKNHAHTRLYFVLTPRSVLTASAMIALAFSGAACSREASPPAKETPSAHAGEAGQDKDGHAHHHEHKAPHDGTVVELGEEAAHLELVLDPAAGRLRAYVLDGELENFIRVKDAALALAVRDATGERAIILAAVADPATGETVGDTSLFEASAEWLKTTPRFDAVVREVTVRGATYRDVAFKFPEGNEHEGHDHE